MGKFGDTAKGAAGGAATGAVVGSVVPGIGTAAGAIGGGLLGGLTGYLSSDSGSGGSGVPGMRLNDEAGIFQYGGQDYDPEGGPSGAEKRAGYYDSLGSYYANRPDTAADYTTADQDYQRQQEARAAQMGLGQQYQAVIDGTAGPSLAELQMRANQDNTAQQALNMAASARGGGGMLAAQQAQQANALGQARVGMDAGMLRAQETAQAREGARAVYGDIRGGDLGSMGQRADMAQAQAGIGLQSEQQRYGQGMGYRQGADALRESQRDANIGIWQGNQSARTAMATGAQQAAAADRASNRAAVAGVVGAGLGAGATMYTGGKKK